MAYVLFAQQKIALTGNYNMISLQQTQRSNEQTTLATQTLSLQQQLSAMQASQSLELAQLYELLSHVSSDDKFDENYLQSFSETHEVTHPDGTVTQEPMRDINDYSADARQFLEPFLNGDADAKVSRDQINAKIKELQSGFDAELADINNEIYQTGVKENVLEMEVKRLDTALSAVQKKLEAIQEAEGKAIDNSTPKFQGMG